MTEYSEDEKKIKKDIEEMDIEIGVTDSPNHPNQYIPDDQQKEQLAEKLINRDIEEMDIELGVTSPLTPLTPLTSPNTPNSPNPTIPYALDYPNITILNYLKKVKAPHQSIARGIKDDIFYIGTYVEDEVGHTKDAIVTSNRRMFIDGGRDNNEIKRDFGLKYREHFYFDVLDATWSNRSIENWLFNNYTVDIRDLYEEIVKINKKYIVYEDDRWHNYIAVDIMRSYFFILFAANSRTLFNAEKGSGKTNQLMIYRGLSFNPLASADFSSSSIYRTIEGTSATILIDDYEKLLGDVLTNIDRHIKVNYKPFKTMRSDGGQRFRPQGYNSYSHCVFNNTVGINYDPVMQERVVTIRLSKHKITKNLEVKYLSEEFNQLRDDLYICLLQYWKKVKEIYDSLKVEGLTSRELEIFKPQLSIAKVLGEDVYNSLLSLAKDYIEQESYNKDLEDDWEFILFRYLWKHTEDLDENDKKKTKGFIGKELTDAIANNELHWDLNYDMSYRRMWFTLSGFIGGKLRDPRFSKRRPGNCVTYVINRQGLKEIIDNKGWLEIIRDDKNG